MVAGDPMVAHGSALMALVRAIAADDTTTALQLITRTPDLATAPFNTGATRQAASDHYLDTIAHYIYAGDTALHLACAGYRTAVVQRLIAAGANVGARNRRDAQPLHYAADGIPGGLNWHPDAQATTIIYLIGAGADPNAIDRSGVAPLHRAVRTRCASAVSALLDSGADALLRNRNGSTPLMLATQATGRGGSGSAASKAQQEQIVALLARHGSTR